MAHIVKEFAERIGHFNLDRYMYILTTITKQSRPLNILNHTNYFPFRCPYISV